MNCQAASLMKQFFFATAKRVQKHIQQAVVQTSKGRTEQFRATVNNSSTAAPN